MNSSALMMMIISMVLLWGGLVLATIHLVKHPDEEED
ncbi:methionine/alanine import family NSS transporter small subunit [Acinetobacter tianfuensis]|uniref:Methionine/alanine import family NSS transporter small subunit n=1 Tax=Acinetobacter tianfuensis TaxID=2419603 RepID=A0A3A8EBB1_9GAMM|nr:methionine/alanine import family NSS transporter small subunit [Acinetobacter tianfuensis]RKG31955.1 methionine/alanine import family NSS transporter small subunit [Acinetobacter tianfuensis]